MMARPGVEKGRHVPTPHRIKELLGDPAAVEKHAKAASEWIQRGQKGIAK